VKKIITLGSLDKQPLLYFPSEFIEKYASAFWVVDYRNVGVRSLELRVVDPKSTRPSSIFKFFKIVRHNGAVWTSVPKNWLRDIGANAGDRLEVDFGTNSAIVNYVRVEK
jgi:hypothetical protein